MKKVTLGWNYYNSFQIKKLPVSLKEEETTFPQFPADCFWSARTESRRRQQPPADKDKRALVAQKNIQAHNQIPSNEYLYILSFFLVI